MIKATVLTKMSGWVTGGAECAKLKEAIAAMENMEDVEASFRESIAAKINETRKSITDAMGEEGKEAVVCELEAALTELETTQAKAERGRQSRQRRLREARATLAALRR